MKILIVEPCKSPREADIPHTLEAMQNVVGGYIQAIYPWEDQVALVCDEEGLLKRSPFNRLISPENPVFGTFFLCGLAEESFSDLPQAMIEKYAQLLRTPQKMVLTPDGIIVLPMLDSQLPKGDDEHV